MDDLLTLAINLKLKKKFRLAFFTAAQRLVLGYFSLDLLLLGRGHLATFSPISLLLPKIYCCCWEGDVSGRPKVSFAQSHYNKKCAGYHKLTFGVSTSE